MGKKEDPGQIVQSPRGPISGLKRAAQFLPPQAGE